MWILFHDGVGGEEWVGPFKNKGLAVIYARECKIEGGAEYVGERPDDDDEGEEA